MRSQAALRCVFVAALMLCFVTIRCEDADAPLNDSGNNKQQQREPRQTVVIEEVDEDEFAPPPSKWASEHSVQQGSAAWWLDALDWRVAALTLLLALAGALYLWLGGGSAAERTADAAGGGAGAAGGGGGAAYTAEELRRARLQRFGGRVAVSGAAQSDGVAVTEDGDSADATRLASVREARARQAAQHEAMAQSRPPAAQHSNSNVEVASQQDAAPQHPRNDSERRAEAVSRLVQRSAEVSSEAVPSTVKSPTPEATAAVVVTPEFRVHLALQDVFNVLLNAAQHKHLPHYHLLTDLARDLREAEEPVLLTPSLLDSVLLEVSQQLKPGDYLRYLYHCFSRAIAAPSKRPAPDIVSALVAARRAILVQSAFIVQETLARTGGREDVLLQLLQRPPPDAVDLPSWIASLARHLVAEQQHAALAQIMAGSFHGVRHHISQLQLCDVWSAPMSVLKLLVHSEDIASLLTQRSDWLPLVDPPNGGIIEKQTYLGAFFSLSCVQDRARASYFPSSIKYRHELEGAKREAQRSLSLLRDALVSVCRQLMRNPKTRVAMRDWFLAAIRGNLERSKIHGNWQVTSSDGFTINVAAVLLRMLLQELREADDVGKIQRDYWLLHLPLEWEADVALSPSEEVTEWKQRASQAVAFARRPRHVLLNDLFFLSLAAIRVSLPPSELRRQAYVRRISSAQDEAQRLEAQRAEWAAAPNAHMFEARLSALRSDVERATQVARAFEAEILDAAVLSDIVELYSMFCKWLLDAVPAEGQEEGEKERVPVEFGAIPERILEDFGEICKLVVLSKSVSISGQGKTRFLIDFLVTFVGKPSFVRNPYLRGLMAEILSQVPVTAFAANGTARASLISSLLSLWVDVEVMDRHNAYHEKFPIRHRIVTILFALQNDAHYRAQLRRCSESMRERYIRFVNMLLNDVDYALDEVIRRLKAIKEVEEEMADETAWYNQTAETRANREAALRQDVGVAQSTCAIAESFSKLLLYISSVTPQAFWWPELVSRTASMLNYFTVGLAGPKYNDLNVRRSERFKFDARTHLARMIGVYGALAQSADFVRCVAEDERSFDAAAFRSIAQLLRKRALVSEEDQKRFSQMVEQAEGLAEEIEEQKVHDEEAPEEFFDPIACVIMSDPVVLPSGHVMDKAVICKYLLDKQQDPFTREPLTIDMLRPHPELAKRIREWQLGKAKEKPTGKDEE